MRSIRGVLLLLLTCAALACTEGNPTYLPDTGGTGGDTNATETSVMRDGAADWNPGRDGGRDGKIDGKPTPDTKPPFDIYPWPDSVPWQCATDNDCNDGKTCTVDKCTAQKKCDNSALVADTCLIAGKCYSKDAVNTLNSCQACQPSLNTKDWTTLSDGAPCKDEGLTCTNDQCKGGLCVHPVASGKCLISSTCYDDGGLNPQNSCEACDADQSTSSWTTLGDNTACKADSLTCTNDVCKSGQCTHPTASGWCLISGTCYQQGTSPSSDACNECVTSRSQSAWTFVAGKPCGSGTGLARMCFASQCRGWTQAHWEPPSSYAPLATALNGVDYIGAASGAWAAGEYLTSSSAVRQGMIIPLGAGSPAPAVVYSKAALAGIHYRLAVGASGLAFYYSGGTWSAQSAIETALNGTARSAVHGALVGGLETFLLGGAHSSSGISGVVRCVEDTTSGFKCDTSYTGFDSGALLGGVFGSVTSAGAAGPAWAARFASSGSDPEDIFATDWSTSAWSRTAPLGCQDQGSGSTPCSNTQGAYRDLFGSSASDVWVVGTGGILLQYNGTQWSRLSSRWNNQTDYTLTAVYSSPSDKLVTLAGYRTWGTGRQIVFINYNTDLGRWLGPIVIVQVLSPTDELRDIGGKGYSDLWAVGTQVTGSTVPRPQGWILRFQ